MTPTFFATARRRGALALIALSTAAAPMAAQATQQAEALDRTRIPDAGRAPELRVPTWTTTRLANGAELVVSRRTGLPLVSVRVNFSGGSAQFERPDKIGVATLTSAMMSEGTATRSGDDLANAQQLLGTTVTTGIGRENGSIGFTALSSKLEPALELMADMMLNPSFPGDALERRKGQLLVNIRTARDNPSAIANNVFSKVLYGDEHPYGRVATEEVASSVTRDDIVAFHREYFRPGRAVITVVGDVDPARVRTAFEKAFANWAPGGERPSFDYPAVPAPRARAIYLVDKPKAAQSVFALGLPGPERDNPDYFAIRVMNTILGELFMSRLQYKIREEKGYSYGAGSNFAMGKGPGAFRASSSIVTAKSDSALIVFMEELRGVQGAKPFTEDEIKQGKESLIQSLPGQFGRVNGVAGAISAIYLDNLPQTYYQEFAARVNAVTADDLVRVAKKYIDLDRINIVIVGDRAVIEEPLRKTGIAPIVLLDIHGKPVPAATP